ncbi:MAG: patatin-like phospholipase family protein [Flavobacteriales bacterium]
MYKILSLDGGGSWSILQLLMLKEQHGDILGHELLKQYDLVIANSGGSIVLAALCENMLLSEAQSLFDDGVFLKQVFSKTTFKERFFPTDFLGLFGSFGPKYSTKRKKEAFESTFKEVHKRQMAELPEWIGKPDLRLMVATYDALNNRAKFFKSFSHDSHFDSVKLTQAINGSSNAPIQYFDFPTRFKAQETDVFYELWDGALGGFNNPIAAGICEALKLGVPADDIHVISLGTAKKVMSMEDKHAFWEAKQAAQGYKSKKFKFGKYKLQLNFFKMTVINQAKTILYEPPDWANYVSMMLLLRNDLSEVEKRIVRMSPFLHLTEENTSSLMQELYDLDMDLTEDADIKRLYHCYALYKSGEIHNQPLDYKISRNNKLIFKRGHRSFKDALDQWELILADASDEN